MTIESIIASKMLFNISELSLMTSITKSEIYRDVDKGVLVADVVAGRRRATQDSVRSWLSARGLKIGAK